MDAAGEVAELAQRLLGAHSRLGEPSRLARLPRLGVVELLLCHAEAHPERDDARLGPVVEIAPKLDSAQLLLLGVDRPRAGARQHVDALAELLVGRFGEEDHARVDRRQR